MMSLPRRLRRFETSETLSGISGFSVVSAEVDSSGSSLDRAGETGFWLGIVGMCNSVESE